MGRNRSSIGRKMRFKHHKLITHNWFLPTIDTTRLQCQFKPTGPKFSKLRCFMHLKLCLKHFQELHMTWQCTPANAWVSKLSSGETGLSGTPSLCKTYIWHLICKYLVDEVSEMVTVLLCLLILLTASTKPVTEDMADKLSSILCLI